MWQGYKLLLHFFYRNTVSKATKDSSAPESTDGTVSLDDLGLPEDDVRRLQAGATDWGNGGCFHWDKDYPFDQSREPGWKETEQILSILFDCACLLTKVNSKVRSRFPPVIFESDLSVEAKFQITIGRNMFLE